MIRGWVLWVWVFLFFFLVAFIYLFIYLFIYFAYLKLEYGWFTLLCQFLLYDKVTQSYIYIYIQYIYTYIYIYRYRFPFLYYLLSWSIKSLEGVPIVEQQKWIRLVSMRLQVQSLALLSGSAIRPCHGLWYGSQIRLGSGVAVAVAQAGSCISDSTLSLGTSMCHGYGPLPPPKKRIWDFAVTFKAFEG